MSRIQRQSGAVSLFVVIFAILLMSVVTVSFIRIMTQDQSQASSNDLSQSAFDSSQAGAEDAKRALLKYNESCTGISPASWCGQFVSGIDECNASIRTAGVIKAGDVAPTEGGSGTGEIKVQQSTSVDVDGNSIDKALDQAYTCVTMQLDTDDYVGSLTPNDSVLIPLLVTDQTRLTTVTVEWFNRDDVANPAGTVNVANTSGSQPLTDPWPADRPPVMRTQFMQVGNSFKLSDFDSTSASSESNSNTLFLYPARNGFSTAPFSTNVRKSPTGNSIPADASNTPLPSKCQTSVSSGNLACKITLDLPAPVRGGTMAKAYLRLTSMYTSAHYRITVDGTQFKNVQPIIDSTGRANDVLRRVESRVDLYDTNTFPYPDGAVDVSGDFCKDFGVTDSPDYIAGSCTP